MVSAAPSKKTDTKSLRTITIYCLIVVSLIVISLVFKSVSIFLQSTFSSKTHFTVVIKESSTESAIVAFNPDKKSMVDLSVKHKKGVIPEQQLRILTDSEISIIQPVKPMTSKEYLSYFLLHPGSYKTELTIFDLFRMWVYSGFTAKDITEKQISLPLTDSDIDSTLSNMFYDDLFITDNVTLEIVNGTGVPGLASKLERAITRMGGNVIAVSNARPEDAVSQVIYYDDYEGKYVRERIAKLLKFPMTQINKKSLSDIIIVIGEDIIPPIVK